VLGIDTDRQHQCELIALARDLSQTELAVDAY
jgi:hypothetical protein